MKRFFAVLCTAVVLVLTNAPLVAAQTTENDVNQPNSVNLTDNFNSLSERCQRALQPSVVREIANEAGMDFDDLTGELVTTEEAELNRTIDQELGLTNNPNQEIYVLLSESIIQNGSEYSCGEIVSCIRDRYRGRPDAERLVTRDIKKDYDFCIVTGTDGIDLLTNYAGLVYQWIAGIVGGVCVLVIVFSGIQISIGGLSQEEVSSAKDRVVRALSGLVVLFLSAFILYSINPFFFG